MDKLISIVIAILGFLVFLLYSMWTSVIKKNKKLELDVILQKDEDELNQLKQKVKDAEDRRKKLSDSNDDDGN